MAAVVNQVEGSGGLPELTRVGSPEGSRGPENGWSGFTSSDHLSGFRLWDAALPNAADYRTIIIRWQHKSGAPASSGSNEYLLARPDNAAVNNYGGADYFLTSAALESSSIRAYARSSATNWIAHTDATWSRGTEWWTFLVIRDPAAGVPQVEINGYEEGDPDRVANIAGTAAHVNQVDWDPDAGDHFVGYAPHAAASALANAEILGIGLYDGALSATQQADLADGTSHPQTLAGMLTWYNGTTFPTVPTHTAMGGESRTVVRDHRGVWILLFDLGGQPWRVATRAVRVPSRRVGRVFEASAGLSTLDFDVDAETAQVSVRGAAEDQWATDRRRYGPLKGRRFELWRWYEGAGDLEDGRLALQGLVDGASWANPGDPHALSLTLRRSLRGLSLVLPPETARVDDDTWPVRALYPTDETVKGQRYPWVIGHPGSRISLSATAAPLPSTPGLLVEGAAHPTSRVLVAGHRVGATTVRLHNLASDPPTSDDRPVQYIDDLRGREIAYVDFAATTLTPAEGAEWVVGWDRRSAYGGGLVHQGRLVQGLGDVLIWGAQTFSTATHDAGEMESRRAALNRYTIDTHINQTVLWDDWLRSSVLELFDIEAVHGPRGIYYRERVYQTDASKARARLTADRDGGVPVVRVSSVTASVDETANHITVEFDPMAGSSSSFRRRVALGPVARVSDLGADTQVGGALLAVHSAAAFGVRAKVWQTVVTSDPRTADLVAARKMSKHAMPADLVVYRGGHALADLRMYDTVTLQDTRAGARYTDDLGIVWGRTIEDGDTFQVLVRIPYDPTRHPTLAQ